MPSKCKNHARDIIATLPILVSEDEGSLEPVRSRARRREVKAMGNLLILVGSMIVASRMVWPLLRIAISMMVKLVGFAFFIAMALLLAIAILTHGAFI
jgi:hypothetical protein